MMSFILERLEQLRAELAVVDPTNEAEAADAIAAIAVSAREIVAGLASDRAHIAEMPRVPLQVAV